jgi:hypothetical protein
VAVFDQKILLVALHYSMQRAKFESVAQNEATHFDGCFDMTHIVGRFAKYLMVNIFCL